MSSASAAIPQPGRTKAFLRLVMIEHSIFALPFAYIASLTAMYEWDRTIHWGRLLLVTVAMVGLRTFAMAVNRIIDREIDARNPRTAHRELVTGAMSVRHAWTGALVALVVFLAAAALLNPLCLALAPVAVVPMVVYPYGKRFTNFPQAILGLAQAMGPIGGWLAISGSWSWEAVILGLAVGIWIGGFDLIYACQDVETDREVGVKSVPARFGVPAAIRGHGPATSSPPRCSSGTPSPPAPAPSSGWAWSSSRAPSSTSTRSSARTTCPASTGRSSASTGSSASPSSCARCSTCWCAVSRSDTSQFGS